MGVDRRRELSGEASEGRKVTSRGLDGTEGARMRYLAARVEHAEAEREAVGVLLSLLPSAPRLFLCLEQVEYCHGT
jgi:hypothetical protein